MANPLFAGVVHLRGFVVCTGYIVLYRRQAVVFLRLLYRMALGNGFLTALCPVGMLSGPVYRMATMAS